MILSLDKLEEAMPEAKVANCEGCDEWVMTDKSQFDELEGAVPRGRCGIGYKDGWLCRGCAQSGIFHDCVISRTFRRIQRKALAQ